MADEYALDKEAGDVPMTPVLSATNITSAACVGRRRRRRRCARPPLTPHAAMCPTATKFSLPRPACRFSKSAWRRTLWKILAADA